MLFVINHLLSADDARAQTTFAYHPCCLSATFACHSHTWIYLLYLDCHREREDGVHNNADGVWKVMINTKQWRRLAY